jgi:hypothetical protein
VSTRNQTLCAWSGIAFVVLFTIGFWPLAHFLPPPSPRAGAEVIAAAYRENTLSIRLGTLLTLGASGLMLPFVAAISMQMRRMEGRYPVLSYAQLASGTVGVLFFIIPSVIWSLAAFRPERDPQLTLLLSDMGWMLFLMPFASFVVQSLCIGLAILGDRAPDPVFPRWTGFFNFWVAALVAPGGIITFFKSGPFAWDGLFGFWIPLVIFFAWYLILFVYLRVGIARQGAASDLAGYPT